MDRIVIGVDGSEVATAALSWVVRLARLRGARVEVITVAAGRSRKRWASSPSETDGQFPL